MIAPRLLVVTSLALLACGGAPPPTVAAPSPASAPSEPEPVCSLPVELGTHDADIERGLVRESRRALAAEGACERSYKIVLKPAPFDYSGGDLHLHVSLVVQTSKGEMLGELTSNVTMTGVRGRDANAEQELLRQAGKQLGRTFASNFR